MMRSLFLFRGAFVSPSFAGQSRSPPYRLSITGKVDHRGHGLVHLALADNPRQDIFAAAH
jgi:hypothetical protein